MTQLRCTVLDVIELREPIHSGEYLAEHLIAVIDDYGITPAVFTITRDNASAHTTMLSEYENLACKNETTLQQQWAYTTKEGDVRCIETSRSRLFLFQRYLQPIVAMKRYTSNTCTFKKLVLLIQWSLLLSAKHGPRILRRHSMH